MEDLRIKKTREAIEQATINLIELKGFNNVRLTEIAKVARVNRNTIYLHYKSKEDIIMSIIERTFINFNQTLDAARLFSGRMLKNKTREIVNNTLNSLNENIELYRIILTDPNLFGYFEIAIGKVKDLAFKSTKQTQSHRLAVEYIVSGIYGIITRWIIYATGSINEVASVITDFTYNNVKQLQFLR